MTRDDALRAGREAYRARDWSRAHARLAEADAAGPLEAADVELLARAGYLLGRPAESVDLLARAHHEFLARRDLDGAARTAFWAGLQLFQHGEHARGGGWLARAHRLVEDDLGDCVHRGYLLIPEGLQHLGAGAPDTALGAFVAATGLGERYGDADLTTLGRLGQGQALIRAGRVSEGLLLLDEAMVAVTADEVDPIPAGIVYCAVIVCCRLAFDLRRAQEWTTALTRWCASQPDLVPYTGQCQVHRAQLLLARGAWADALAAAELAEERLGTAADPAAGAACYERAEVHRLRGELAAAEDAYRAASRWGHEPQPGLALLRAAAGQASAAAASLQRALAETGDPPTRVRLLAAAVEVALADGDVGAARAAADEVAGLAAGTGLPWLQGLAAHAAGAVLLAEGAARDALAELRRAARAWQELGVPYEAARVRVLIGLACRDLGDADAAELDLDAARAAFRALGAVPDADRVDALAARPAPAGARCGLTAREVEVLRLVAAGLSNRRIAAELVLSEKTVARHVSNILGKLGLPSRAAATAYAYEHRLVGVPEPG